jgi:hypothetical protein
MPFMFLLLEMESAASGDSHLPAGITPTAVYFLLIQPALGITRIETNIKVPAACRLTQFQSFGLHFF